MMTLQTLRVLVASLVFIGCGAGCQRADNAAAKAAQPGGRGPGLPANPFAQRLRAPELLGGEWVNTAQPIRLADLRGRFVLLDFWTYCCINCMHVLPELKKIEHAYPNELVVIGVHSAKFTGEKDTENIREAIYRYEIEHPVVNDADLRIWRAYSARSWPTLLLIDPLGDAVWVAFGERTFEDLKEVIDAALPFYRAQGLLRPAPRPATVADASRRDSTLRYPGKVLADEATGRLFVADSSHNRFLVVGLDGQTQLVIGSGKAGASDGPFSEASFNHPQGMALVGDLLYVADTENHRLRKIDLEKKTVATVAGTGKRGSGWPLGDNEPGGRLRQPAGMARRFAGMPKTTPLASPWALWPHGDDLYIAMAGSHQIWKMPLDESEIGPYAGNGNEAIMDGPLLPAVPYDPQFASFAQPSGLASDGQRLFVADSEGSIIRIVPIGGRGETESLAGPVGGNLFNFGDVDGVGNRVRFQHPLGVAWQDGKLYVADTYNNKIKVVDVATRRCTTLAGTGKPGREDAAEGAKATFNEPSGLSIAAGKLYVADTNNHAVRIVDLTPPHSVATLAIESAAPPETAGAARSAAK
jgi:DNA-binding beta-propeller fold protein YncE